MMKLNDRTWVNPRYVERLDIVLDPSLVQMRAFSYAATGDLDPAIPDVVQITFASGGTYVERELSVEEVLDRIGPTQ